MEEVWNLWIVCCRYRGPRALLNVYSHGGRGATRGLEECLRFLHGRNGNGVHVSHFEIQIMEMVAPTAVNTEIQTSKYCNVADLGVLISDYSLTLKPEVRWTWNRRHHSYSFSAGMTSYGEQLPVFPAYLTYPHSLSLSFLPLPSQTLVASNHIVIS
ncbi:hypothetical protein C8R48DRAFT_762088 [Suillus tomentosus]|nr:hypothetical protein C8R48DRAFT_762088 [Suillus tomentosus]